MLSDKKIKVVSIDFYYDNEYDYSDISKEIDSREILMKEIDPRRPEEFLKASDVKEAVDELKKFHNEVKILLTEAGTEFPSNWKDIPKKYQDEFSSWVGEYKQQTWEGNEHKGWECYFLEFIQFLLNNKIEDVMGDL